MKTKEKKKSALSFVEMQVKVIELENQLDACLKQTQKSKAPIPAVLKNGKMTSVQKKKINGLINNILSDWDKLKTYERNGTHFLDGGVYRSARTLLGMCKLITPKLSAVRFFYKALYKKAHTLEVTLRAQGEPMDKPSDAGKSTSEMPRYIFLTKAVHYVMLQSLCMLIKAHVEHGWSLRDDKTPGPTTI